MQTRAPFIINPVYTAIVVAYTNQRYIADQVLPRVYVGRQDFAYIKMNLEQHFTIPTTFVGRRSRTNEISFSADEEVESTEDYGLEDPVPNRDIDNAPKNHDPLANSSESLIDIVMQDREQRVANLVFDADSYSASNRMTLSGSDQWHDPASRPIDIIMDAMDSMIMRPNVLVLGRKSFSALIRNPQIVKAYHGNTGDTGIATRDFITELFELDEVVVGEARTNIAKKGQPVTLARLWGNHASLTVRDRLISSPRDGRITFGFTAQFGERLAGEQEDPDIGLMGGIRLRVGESLKELITAKDLGYFIQNAAA
ncbi:hypothetical protein J2T55_000801 [Methylohalomonas lacus]|uniref:Capsid protein n=1 Tax=Methylohalomonas lacus TaxID=398773 RepID=A0AAE3HKU4_9GAMM|nr:phage capsid protein [Methylohalomonas lacus]MCS3902797.1 hypothetical protein [Methylohalomonas lacus]